MNFGQYYLDVAVDICIKWKLFPILVIQYSESNFHSCHICDVHLPKIAHILA